jgi:hypothetical protein
VIGYDPGSGYSDSFVNLWYSPSCRTVWTQAYTSKPISAGGNPLTEYVQRKTGPVAGSAEYCLIQDNYNYNYLGYECSTAMLFDAGVVSKGYAEVIHRSTGTQELITAAY